MCFYTRDILSLNVEYYCISWWLFCEHHRPTQRSQLNCLYCTDFAHTRCLLLATSTTELPVRHLVFPRAACSCALTRLPSPERVGQPNSLHLAHCSGARDHSPAMSYKSLKAISLHFSSDLLVVPVYSQLFVLLLKVLKMKHVFKMYFSERTNMPPESAHRKSVPSKLRDTPP